MSDNLARFFLTVCLLLLWVAAARINQDRLEHKDAIEKLRQQVSDLQKSQQHQPTNP